MGLPPISAGRLPVDYLLFGAEAEKRIEPGTELEYVIRFQNTGTDTAYTVKVVDTLDTAIDPSSFTEGVSSHPYTLEISGKGQLVVTFNFYNINLPDSTIDKAGSQGLVSFRITIPASSPLGTVVRNRAYIYFDYNSPIITNETMHTVDNSVENDLSKGSLVQVGTTTNLKNTFKNNLKVYPNPSEGIIIVELPETTGIMEMRIVSLVGIVQKTIKLNSADKQEVNLNGITEGLYVYEILQNGERKAGGMLQVR